MGNIKIRKVQENKSRIKRKEGEGASAMWRSGFRKTNDADKAGPIKVGG